MRSALAVLVLTAAACSQQTVVALGVSEHDHDTDFAVPAGTAVLVTLPASYEWMLQVTDPGIVRVRSSSVAEGSAQWVLQTVSAGSVKVLAVGVPKCRSAQPACPDRDRQFRVGLDVRR